MFRRYYGPEFVATAILRWLHDAQIETALIDPGKPWQNATDESFNGRFRDEYLTLNWFRNRVDAKVGMVQRPERIVLLSVPQAFFGLALNGWVLGVIIVFLSVTAWITVVQRMVAVYEQTTERAAAPPIPLTTEKTFWLRRKRRTGTRR
jgi:transposase InsO family protein